MCVREREREREHTCCVLVDDSRDGELSQIVDAVEAVVIIPSHGQNFCLGNYIRRLHCCTICRGGQWKIYDKPDFVQAQS